MRQRDRPTVTTLVVVFDGFGRGEGATIYWMGGGAGGIFGRFRVLATLATGAMGVVYHAVDTSTGEEVALKTVRVPVMAERKSASASMPLGTPADQLPDVFQFPAAAEVQVDVVTVPGSATVPLKLILSMSMF